ncbi:MAG: serine/threonine protein kinase [Candidatus Aenigmarchaeota archaeon]|nr:serine/threonine protein kinase [Candidatus Aenigmarchaeota archaeon]
MEVNLDSGTWRLVKLIGTGSFGVVYECNGPSDEVGAIKLVPKDPSAARELLMADSEYLRSAANIIPVEEIGETDTNFVLRMPLADASLGGRLVQSPVSASEAVSIFIDILDALVSIDGKVVHRDLKPKNILLLSGKWCISDFGIARYFGATTASDTRKFAMTPHYAAPEQWRNERATSATDMYAFGIIAYEILSGKKPFDGTDTSELRSKHLTEVPLAISGVDPRLSSIIINCLNKVQGARPSATNVISC